MHTHVRAHKQTHALRFQFFDSVSAFYDNFLVVYFSNMNTFHVAVVVVVVLHSENDQGDAINCI